MNKSINKILPVFLTVIFICCCAFYTSAESYNGFKIDIPKDFSVAQSGGDFTEISKITEISTDELSKYFKDNNLMLLAVDKDNKNQIKVSSSVNELSREAVSFGKFGNSELIDLGSSIFNVSEENEISNITVTENGGFKFLKYTEYHKDSGGIYSVTRFMTVENGKNYELSVFSPQDSKENLAQSVFDSFIITKEKKPFFSFTNVIFGIAVLLFATVLIVSLVGLIKLLKKKE